MGKGRGVRGLAAAEEDADQHADADLDGVGTGSALRAQGATGRRGEEQRPYDDDWNERARARD